MYIGSFNVKSPFVFKIYLSIFVSRKLKEIRQTKKIEAQTSREFTSKHPLCRNDLL